MARKRTLTSNPAPRLFCLPRALPPDLEQPAARTAIEHNPANEPRVKAQPGGAASSFALVAALMAEPAHLALLTTRYWGAAGIKLSVGFLEPVAAGLRDRLLSHMNAWGDFANVAFAWTQSAPSADVRLTLAGDGYWSYLGTDVRSIAPGEPTMCLEGFTMSTPEGEYRRVVRHETGHTLGFPHEHLRAALVAKLDPQRTIAYFQRVVGWPRQMTIQQVLTPLRESDLTVIDQGRADALSIMTYQLSGECTVDGKPIQGGSDIDDQDRALAAKVYPKATAPGPGPGPAPGKVTLSIECDPAARTARVVSVT